MKKYLTKRIPDYNFNYFTKHDSYMEEVKNKSCVYVYFYKGICLYVGATKHIYFRALRVFMKKDSSWSFFDALVRVIGNHNLKLLIFLHDEKDLRESEKRYFKKFKPITQHFCISYHNKFIRKV